MMMRVVYVNMTKPSQLITLPKPIGMMEDGHMMGSCQLIELNGSLRTKKESPFFLCADCVLPSYVEDRQIPILRRLVGESTEDDDGELLRIDQVYDQSLVLPVTRSPLDEFRLYISDASGNILPVENCQLQCTLLFENQ